MFKHITVAFFTICCFSKVVHAQEIDTSKSTDLNYEILLKHDLINRYGNDISKYPYPVIRNLAYYYAGKKNIFKNRTLDEFDKRQFEEKRTEWASAMLKDLKNLNDTKIYKIRSASAPKLHDYDFEKKSYAIDLSSESFFTYNADGGTGAYTIMVSGGFDARTQMESAYPEELHSYFGDDVYISRYSFFLPTSLSVVLSQKINNLFLQMEMEDAKNFKAAITSNYNAYSEIFFKLNHTKPKLNDNENNLLSPGSMNFVAEILSYRVYEKNSRTGDQLLGEFKPSNQSL